MSEEFKTELINAGMNVEEALERCMGSEELMQTLLSMLLTDKSYEQLIKALNNKNAEEGYMQAHTLKGVAGNLSLISLYESTIPIMNLLKAGDSNIPTEMLNNLSTNYTRVCKVISNYIN